MRELMKQFGWAEPIMPMNAKDPKEKLEKLFKDSQYIGEIKYDGSRYLCIGTPEGGRFFSRKKSENKKNPETLGLPVEKTANIPHLSMAFKDTTFIVDGEVFYPGKKSNHVTSIMGCDPEKAIERQEGEFGRIHYMLYDILYYGGVDVRDQPWHTRRDMLEEIYEYHFGNYEYIHLSQPVYGEDSKRALLKHAEDTGEEGIMLKNVNSKYQSDKRPEHHWYKVKGEIVMDVVVMGYEPPEKVYTGKDLNTWQYWESASGALWERGAETIEELLREGMTPVTRYYYEGQIGSVIFGLYKDGVLTKAGTCSGMTDELRMDLTEDATIGGNSNVGRVIEIKAMERTEKGLFRHPRWLRWRDDKGAQDCLWEVELD